MLGESCCKELWEIPLADNTTGRRTSDISEDLWDQQTDQFKTSRSALQVDDATDVVKDAHLVSYF
jgi:hypothetical protein